MGKQKAPSPPDPKDTAAASTGTNVSTAIANAYLGNVNQVTPDGSLNYSQSGMYTMNDPYTGKTYEVPQFTATQTLSPQQQAIQDQNRGAQLNLASAANERSGFLKDYLSQGINTSSLPALQGSAGINSNFNGNLGTGYNTNFSTNVGNGYNTNFKTGVGGGYKTAFNQTTGKNYNEVFNKSIGGSYTDKLDPNYQTSIDLQNTYDGADDFSADRAKYEDALWTRGAEDRAQGDETLRNRLLNSGIREGSAAWNAEMRRMGSQNEDARLATYLAAGNEQARMIGLAHQAATFGNDSRLAESTFGNNAITNQFSLQNKAAADAAQFGSNQQQNQNTAALNNATFLRDNQINQNAAALGQAQFGSQQQANQNAAAMGLAQFGSQQQANQNTSLTNQAQFASSQQQAANNAAMAAAQFQNNARSQGLQETYAARAQPINEVIGLMGGSQIQQPNFVNANMPTIPTTDTAGLINNNYNQQMAAYNANQANTGGLLGGIGSLAGGLIGMTGLSDDDAKTDKKRLGDVDGEMGAWEFRYKGEPKSQPKHIGLMASEVEKARPSAIHKKNGMRYVDYGLALSGK